jgi:hypothetical protein
MRCEVCMLRYYEGKRRRERPRVCKFCALERRGPYITVRPRVFLPWAPPGPLFLPHAGHIFCLSGAAPSSRARRPPPSAFQLIRHPPHEQARQASVADPKERRERRCAGGHASVASGRQSQVCSRVTAHPGRAPAPGWPHGRSPRRPPPGAQSSSGISESESQRRSES